MNSTRLIDLFLDSAGYADSTRESYRYVLYRALGWLDQQGGLALEDLTLKLYQQFLGSHDWSNNMKRLYGAALRAYFKFYEWPDHPIFQEVLPRDDAPPGRALDHDELRDLLASFDTTKAIGWRNLAILALMAETGLRASEVCKIDLKRVDLRHFEITAQVKGKKKGERKWRKAIVSEDVRRFLEIWLDERPKYAKPDVHTLFVSLGGTTRGKPLTRGGLRALFRQWGEKADIGKLSPHDMRRTMAVLLIEAGAPTRLVQVLGGWDDIRMVERYTQTLKPSQIDRYSPIRSLGLSVDREPSEVTV